jgi:hypothetical protein
MTSTRSHCRTVRLQVGLVAGATVLAVFASSCAGNTVPGADAPPLASTPAPASQAPTVAPGTTSGMQTSEGGQVTVAVTWEGRQGRPLFKVALDTHSVDLDAIDLSQMALLRTDQGVEIRPTGWDAPKGGHHRSGTLSFPEVAADGAPLFDASTDSVELVIRNVAGIPERRFRLAL